MIDFLLHQFMCVALVALSVERLLHMYYKTDPAVDILGWFLLGAGAFAQLVWSVELRPGYADVILLIGAGLLLAVHTHPRLRRFCADRRKNPNRKPA